MKGDRFHRIPRPELLMGTGVRAFFITALAVPIRSVTAFNFEYVERQDVQYFV